jgi:hypothetical protein
MKKLITTLMIFTAIGLYAEQNPAPPVYCECTGTGKPTNTSIQLPAPTPPQTVHLSFAMEMFYNFELWATLFGNGIYK